MKGTTTLLLTLVLLVGACELGTVVHLVNKEVKSESSNVLDARLKSLKLYSVGDVLIEPYFYHVDGHLRQFGLMIVARSPRERFEVSIQSLRLRINGDDVEYGSEIVGGELDGRMYDESTGYFVAHFRGETIPYFSVDDLTDDFEVEVELRARALHSSGAFLEDTIRATFVPWAVTDVVWPT